jgi:hypothetical protein
MRRSPRISGNSGTLLIKYTNRNIIRKYEERAGLGWIGGKNKREINSRDKSRGLICREARGWMLDLLP